MEMTWLKDQEKNKKKVGKLRNTPLKEKNKKRKYKDHRSISWIKN